MVIRTQRPSCFVDGYPSSLTGPSGSEATKCDICMKTFPGAFATGFKTWIVVAVLLFHRCGGQSPTRKSLTGSSC